MWMQLTQQAKYKFRAPKAMKNGNTINSDLDFIQMEYLEISRNSLRITYFGN